MININDIVFYKSPIRFKCWGKVRMIYKIKDSVCEQDKDKIIYRVIPLINNEFSYDDIEISDIFESYTSNYNQSSDLNLYY